MGGRGAAVIMKYSGSYNHWKETRLREDLLSRQGGIEKAGRHMQRKMKGDVNEVRMSRHESIPERLYTLCTLINPMNKE
jgi:hypothetical protein